MKSYRFLCIVFAALLLGTMAAAGQVHNYSVEYRGKEVGSLEAKQTISGRERNTAITSVTSLQLFRQYKVTTRIQDRYEGETLLYAKTDRITNNASDNLTTVTERKDGHYVVSRKGKDDNIDVAAIRYCVSDLYFREPLHVEKVYSETHGQLLDLTRTADGVYVLTLPDGKQNLYHYSGGKLVLVEAVTSLGKISFTLRK